MRRRIVSTLAATAVGMLTFAGSAMATDFAANAGTLGLIPDHVTGCGPPFATPRNVTFTVTGITPAITDVQVTFSMSPAHGWVGDLDVVLIAPNGASQTIFSRTGAIAATDCGDSTNVGGPYTFSDGASAPPNGGWWQTASILSPTVPMTAGTYRSTAPGGAGGVNPSPPTQITPSFAGVPNPNGTWTLRFSDAGGGDTGTVSAATLSLVGTVDATPPAPPLLTGTDPASPANNNSPKVQGSAEAGSQIVVYGTNNCTGTPLVTAAEPLLESPGIGIAVGEDTTTSLSATATDAATNVSPCSNALTYVEDSTAPATQIDSGPAEGATVAESAATLAFSANEPANFVCALDGGADAPCTSPTDYSGLSPGSHTFLVRASDRAGNVDATPETRTWTVDPTVGGPPADRTAPETTIDDTKVKRRKATLSFSSSELNSTFQCKLDDESFAPCTSPLERKHLPRGKHTLAVEAIDAAGNVDATPATKQFKVKKHHH